MDRFRSELEKIKNYLLGVGGECVYDIQLREDSQRIMLMILLGCDFKRSIKIANQTIKWAYSKLRYANLLQYEQSKTDDGLVVIFAFPR